ncbi:hypothetical protein QE152_g20837 [Popillia japonica]|uniref:DDE Tnp4 domain-containing protein n=1 Tax=Popillia japonica TaxID=7064 RepID=A0AAW1KNT6_POPJA
MIKDKKTQFFEVLSYIENDITKTPNTFVNEPISACQPLCLTLRYLATEESFRSMSFNYRISHNHISLIILKPSTVDLIITAACCLHNLLRHSTSSITGAGKFENNSSKTILRKLQLFE